MKQRELAGFWAALLILAAVAVLTNRATAAAARTVEWAAHTHEVLRRVDDIQAAYSRATLARRAFIVSGDASQLAGAPELDARMNAAIAAARASLADNADQKARLDTMAPLLAQRLASLDAAVARRRTLGSASEDQEGLNQASRIRAVREGIEQTENALLSQRNAQTQRDIARTQLVEVAGTLASFAILLVAFRRLRQEVDRRHRSEVALRENERFLDSIVENVPDMLFVKGKDELRFERVNRAAEELLGIDRKELLQKNDFDFFPREQAEFFQSRDRETLSNRAVVDIPEEPIQTKHGERWLHTKKVPVMDENGEPRYLLGISEDITERRQVAAALRDAKEAAENASRELETFSYSVAHDLRAPLRALNGYSSALLEDLGNKLDAEPRDYLARICANSVRMGELIDALLGLSRVGRAPLTRGRVSLTEAARTALEQLRASDPARHVECVVGEGLLAEADPHLVRILLENLLGNAWKFASGREAARIEFGHLDRDASIFFVRDNGAGFDMNYADKLFAPFQRLHSAREFAGTGIGLASVQRIVRRHGGEVWAEGTVNVGATFYFTLDGERHETRSDA